MGNTERSFLDTGLDFSTEEFDPEQQAAMLAWYADVHDVGDLDLAPFARFWIKNDPGGFKRLKRHILTLEDEIDGVSLPLAAGVLMHVFTYTAIGNGKGALYEVIAARALGASKAEILETVRLAVLASGPSGMNPLGDIAEGYFDEWTEPDGPPLEWPSGWAPDAGAFRSGIDPSTDELSDDEMARLVAWHERMHGEVPVHVTTLARLHPRAYKTHRLRYELAFTGALPAQLVPLLDLHVAVNRRWPDAARRAVQMAQALDVRRHQVVTTLFWGAASGGEAALERAASAVADQLEGLA
jgi:hypothetical protein